MWSEPIESALASAHTLLDRLREVAEEQGAGTSRQEIVQVIEQVERARQVRSFEVREGRLVTPEDRW